MLIGTSRNIPYNSETWNKHLFRLFPVGQHCHQLLYYSLMDELFNEMEFSEVGGRVVGEGP